jgi:hypothetical protein
MNETKGLTSKDYKDALDVQDACNLSGVVKAFSRAMSKVWEQARIDGTFGTNDLNTHPIAVLYSDKIASLTGSNGSGTLLAYEYCHKIANVGSVEV